MGKKLSGNEVRYILRSERINLRWLSEQLGITPQTLNSRLNAADFRLSYLIDINRAVGRDIFNMDALPQWTGRQPVIDIRVADNVGCALEASTNKITEYVNIPSLSGSIGVALYGDGMAPRYRAGDILFVRPVPTEAIEYGRAYVVITRHDRLVRVIQPSDIDGCVTISDNSECPAQDIAIGDIQYLYKVVGFLRREQM